MKRVFSLLLIICLIGSTLLTTGCSFKEEDAHLSVKESLNTNYDSLVESLGHMTSFQQLSDFLSSWAKKNKINVKSSNDKYIVLSSNATSGYEKAQSTTLHCVVPRESDKEETFQAVSAAMTTLYSATNHGKLNVIFSTEEKGVSVGTNGLSKKYTDVNNLVNLEYSDETVVNDTIAASMDLNIKHKLKKASPKYTKSYKIILDGPTYRSAFKNTNSLPNGIRTLGNLIASCKSSSILFELASFNGGEVTSTMPGKTTAVIVLQENDVESFQSKFDNSFESVSEDYQDAEEDFSYTMEPVKRPEKVINITDTENIVSLLYTLTNGVYFKSDEGDIIGASNMGTISTKENEFNLKIQAKSLDPSILDEMKTVFATTCALSDMKYKFTNQVELWSAPNESKLIKSITSVNDSPAVGTLQNLSGTIFAESNPKINMAICTINLKNGAAQINSLIEYMEQMNVVNVLKD
ncbi:MAG: hypothetical protein RSD88_00350 [Anaerovoracaceae bacterium]